MLEAMYYGPLCPFWKPAFIVFISSLYLYFGFSNKHFSIQFQFNSIHSEPQMQSAWCRIPALSLIFMFLMSLACFKYQSSIHKQFPAIISIIRCSYCLQADHSCVFECIVSAGAEGTDAGVEHHSQSDASRCLWCWILHGTYTHRTSASYSKLNWTIQHYDKLTQCVLIGRFALSLCLSLVSWGTGIRGLMRGMATLPKVTRSY